MAKYSKVTLNQESVDILLKMASDLKDRYDEYVLAGQDLMNNYEMVYQKLGVDAKPVSDLLERLNDELTLNCEELLDLGAYCETLAKQIESKMGTKLVAKTHFI